MGRKGAKRCDEKVELQELRRDLAKARSKGDYKEMSNIHNRIGVLCRELGHYEDALEEHEEEIAITRLHFPTDVLGLAVAIRAKGEVYLEKKEEENALPLIRQYLQLASSAEDIVEQQRAHITLGRVFFGLADRFTEQGDRDADRRKCFAKAEKEFTTARDLTNHKSMLSLLPASGLVEMKCGVFLNLSLVLDASGRYDESMGFLLKAVELAEKNSLHELLFRANLSLYEIYLRKKLFQEATKAAHDASRSARLLRNSALQAEAKLLEAKADFLTNNVEGGTVLLKKIRKERKDDEFLEEEVNPLLKAAVRITRVEDKIRNSPTDREKRKLYEVLGDKYFQLGNFSSAISNYELALEAGKLSYISDKKHAALLFSLAETLSDLGDYENSKKYFLEELNIHRDDVAEVYKTKSRLTQLLEKGHFPEQEVYDSHRSTIASARKTKNPFKVFLALSNYSAFLKNRNPEEAEQIESEVTALKQKYPNLEEESSQELGNGGNESDSGSSIDLDQLTSEDEDSDLGEEDVARAVTVNKRKFRVNEKGETPLHVAAKKGDVKAVRRLLRQGHEVNPRDSAGWIPLHEAANFGHLEVIKELLRHGARIDDQPGGTDCDKITPIHDAAANGHLEVVDFLITKGANILLKDAHGNLPIDSLLYCYEMSKDGIPDADMDRITATLNHLKAKMAEKGRPYGKEDERRARKKAKQRNVEMEPHFSVKSSRGVKIPVKVTIDDFDPDDGEAAVDFYSNTISGLRSRRKRESHAIEDDESDFEQPGALIAEEEYVDEDWLDDDLRVSRNSKRKRTLHDDIQPQSRRRRDEQRNDVALLDIEPIVSAQLAEASSLSLGEFSPIHIEDEDNSPEIVETVPIISSSSSEESEEIRPISSKRKPRRARQIQTRLPFSIKKVLGSTSTTILEPAVPSSSKSISSNVESSNGILRLKISIGDKIFGVPLRENQSEETIQWLAQEAAKRYAESEGLKPVLRLRTKDGALLGGNDMIRVALGGSETEIEAEILSFDLARLPDRFRESIVKDGRYVVEDLGEILDSLDNCQSSDVLTLKDVNLRESNLLSLLCLSVQCQFALRELNLSGSSLYNEGMKILATLLPTLPSLTLLNLSTNGLTSVGIGHLLEGLKCKGSSLPVKNTRGLTSLDLSFNSVGDSGGQPLSKLLAVLHNLQKLFLIDSDITEQMLQETTLLSALADLKLEELDLRYNDIGESGRRLLSESGVLAHVRVFNNDTFDIQIHT